jgi:hypothetical protein
MLGAESVTDRRIGNETGETVVLMRRKGANKLKTECWYIEVLTRREDPNCGMEPSDGRFAFCWVCSRALLELPARPSIAENPSWLRLE